MNARTVITMLLISMVSTLTGQTKTQEIKGKIFDYITGEPLIGANVSLEGSDPLIGTVTDLDGKYVLSGVPLGRHVVQVSFLGYKQARIPEVLLTSSKPFYLEIALEEDLVNLDMVVVTAQKGKEALNTMATVSSRSFTIEESSRFAGGLSDPSRVAYNFAGVTFSAPQDNGVVIRGNSPTNVLWRLNGIDVSGAAHFGGGNLAGAGLISIYSANILRGSDFMSGAFPAEYGNATSGVFDINFRKGTPDDHKHLVQLGILGVDLSSEGPLSKDKESSYLVNYRHGFIGYYGAMAGGVEPHYQDLSFNLNFPTQDKGSFSLWGIGGLSSNVVPFRKYDKKYDENKDEYNIKYREYFDNFLEKDISFGMGAIGANHKISVGNASFLNSSLGYTVNHYDNQTEFFEQIADTLNTGTLHDYQSQKNDEHKLELASSLYSRWSNKISNETGIRASLLWVDAFSFSAPEAMSALEEHFTISGNATNVMAFTQFKFALAPSLDVNVGVSSTKFGLVDEITLEPRLGLKWQYLPKAHLGLAYGRHTKREELKTYFFQNPVSQQVNDLSLSKADHYVASLGFNLTNNLSLTIEGYYQSLFDVPVIEGSSFSFANYTRLWEVEGPISNLGTGTNIGVDFTLEQVMHKGFYYLLTASIFDSKYKDAQQVERNTLYNRNWITTLAIGKEFVVRKENLLGFNMNVTYMGGGRLTPYFEEKSQEAKSVVYDNSRRFEWQADPELWLNAGITYKVNKDNSTRTWGLDFQNALLTEQRAGFVYNLREGTIDEDKVLFILPNFYYKVEF